MKIYQTKVLTYCILKCITSLQRQLCFFMTHSLALIHCWYPPFHTLLQKLLDLKTPEGGHVLWLLAGDAPVVGLVDGLVVFPG